MSISLQDPLAMPSPPLSSLPTELLSRIAELLSERTLGNLRRTCREIHEKTMFQFGTHHFFKITVVVHPGGFRRLEEVCQHHRFALYVRKIYLRIEDLVNDEYANRPPGLNMVGFNPLILDFIHSGRFAQHLRHCFGQLENLQHISVRQPFIQDFLLERGVDDFRREWSNIAGTILSIIREHQIHLRSLDIWNNNNFECSPHMSILKTISMAPELFDSITRLVLVLFVADDERESWHMNSGEQTNDTLQHLTLRYRG